MKPFDWIRIGVALEAESIPIGPRTVLVVIRPGERAYSVARLVDGRTEFENIPLLRLRGIGFAMAYLADSDTLVVSKILQREQQPPQGAVSRVEERYARPKHRNTRL